MKTCKNLLSVLCSALLLIVAMTGCQEQDIPAANTSLSYPAGEMALGGGTYTSATPSVLSVSTPQFAITGVTLNGAPVSAQIAEINTSTGAISVTPGTDLAALGNYLVSVRMTNAEGDTTFADAFRLVVKGILFEQSDIAATRGEAKTIPVKEAYLVQQQGSVFRLAVPANNPDYAHFSIDTLTCAITVAATAEAGVFPIDIRVENRTNPDGVVFTDVLNITVESKPYDLLYTPATITLIPLEGHVSPRPALRAATLAEGTAVTYSLLDDFGVFTIDAKTGAISLPEDTPLVTQTAKTYKLQVRAANAKGTTSFPDAYTVVVDPNKKAEPVTALVYPGTFPVQLKPGEAWTSERPTVTGSTVGIEFSIDNAPQGVSIDRKTGIVTLAAGHRMPLLTENNSLTVNVRNQGMEAPFTKSLSFSIDPKLWLVQFFTIYSAEAITKSGITNMDRYSFSGAIQSNQTGPTVTPTSIQIRNGFGQAKDKSVNGITCIDVSGANNAQTWAGNTNQNNDWLVSAEIAIPAGSFSPVIAFNFLHQYGTDAQNILELYIIEINAQNVYTKGEQNQDSKGMAAKPSDLEWVALATTDKTDASIPTKIDYNAGTLNTSKPSPRAFDISAYKGKTVRFAFRYFNPSQSDSNARNYRIESLRIEDSLPQ